MLWPQCCDLFVAGYCHSVPFKSILSLFIILIVYYKGWDSHKTASTHISLYCHSESPAKAGNCHKLSEQKWFPLHPARLVAEVLMDIQGVTWWLGHQAKYNFYSWSLSDKHDELWRINEVRRENKSSCDWYELKFWANCKNNSWKRGKEGVSFLGITFSTVWTAVNKSCKLEQIDALWEQYNHEWCSRNVNPCQKL